MLEYIWKKLNFALNFRPNGDGAVTAGEDTHTMVSDTVDGADTVDTDGADMVDMAVGGERKSEKRISKIKRTPKAMSRISATFWNGRRKQIVNKRNLYLKWNEIERCFMFFFDFL